MSTMLEQAIIDAEALRETAMKSAESALIDKYKNVFEQEIEKLLEQETAPETPPTQEMSPETAAANAQDPVGPTTQEPTQAVSPVNVDPNKKDVFEKVKTAFFELDGDDNEMVTINFDSLKAKPFNKSSTGQSALLSSPETLPQDNSAPAGLSESYEIDLDELQEGLKVKIGESYANPGDDSYHRGQAEESEEEYEFEIEESSASLGLKKDAGNLKLQAFKKEAEATSMEAADEAEAEKKAEEEQAAQSQKESSLEEEIELTEEELLELEETLSVDMENVPEGYVGTHKRKEREAKKIAYARARDDKQVKRSEEAKKKLADLEEALDHLGVLYVTEKDKREDLEETNSKLLSVVTTLKEQLEQLNLSNAKLLYTNKVLGNVSLNERQKDSIVENITKAGTVSEAKTIYETLQSTVQSVNQKTPKSLSEALNRGPSPFLIRRSSTNVGDNMSDRMKLLAGIKTN